MSADVRETVGCTCRAGRHVFIHYCDCKVHSACVELLSRSLLIRELGFTNSVVVAVQGVGLKKCSSWAAPKDSVVQCSV